MKKDMKKDMKRIGIVQALVTAFAAIAILVIANFLSIYFGEVLSKLGLYDAIGNIVAGICYPVITFLGLRLLCNKFLKLPPEECKLTRFSVKPVWCIAAILMPALVLAGFLLLSGHWENGIMPADEKYGIITTTVFIYGIGAGLVEEMIFRGVIMSVLEYSSNKYIAIFAPSVLFGALHIIGRSLNPISIVQLMIAGSIVGILFSLVTYESGNVWNSALMHIVWNTTAGGLILNIGTSADEQSIYNYVLDTRSFYITGGDFGIESSVIAIMAYLIFTGVALTLINKERKRQ